MIVLHSIFQMTKLVPSSSVEIYDLSEFAFGLLVVKARSEKAYLFVMHKMTGSLDFSGYEHHSIFKDKKAGQEFIKETYNVTTPIHTGLGIVGIAHSGMRLDLILVTEAIPVAYFFNEHTIFQIKSVKHIWMDVPLFPSETPALEIRRADKIEMFALTDFHMWCETKDVTIPTGFTEPKRDFIWNENLALPFAGLGQRDACLSIVEGTAVTQILNIDNSLIRFTLITVRSAGHAGTRYKARGLNLAAHPANEVQCELIVERSDGTAFCHFWRRGTVPVQWRTVQSKALPTASLEVEDNCDVLTPIYFERLRKEFDNPKNITIANLLHNHETNAEYKLCQAYLTAVSKEANVSYFEFDWHEQKKTLGLDMCVEKFWDIIEGKITSPDFTILKLSEEIDEARNEPTGTLYFPNDEILSQHKHVVVSKQTSFVRVNCMDSLDRTNVGCFFYCVYSLLYGLKKVSSIPKYTDLMALEEDLRVFLAQAFIAIGDTVSFLYTNTPACMTGTFSQVAGLENAPKSDGSIAVQRRIQNFMKDQRRQKGIETFLRIRFPRPKELYCVSSYPACLIPPLPGNIIRHSVLAGIFGYTPVQIQIPVSGKEVQLIISLSQPCYLHSIVMNVLPNHGPVAMSVEAGLLFNSLHRLSSDFVIPKQSAPAPMIFRIPPDLSNGSQITCKIVRISFSTIEPTMTLSNIFIFGTKSAPTEDFILHKSTYESFPDVSSDGKWPRITDTSSVRNVIASLQKLSFSSTMNVELARLHHGKSKLDVIAQLLSRGMDANDYGMNKYKKCMVASAPSKADPCPCCQKDTAPWMCTSCGGQFCTRCDKQNPINDDFLCNGPGSLCFKCIEVYKRRINLLRNVARFYASYWRVHHPLEFATHTFIQKYNGFHNNPLRYPCASFVICDDPDANKVLTDEGGAISSPATYQLCLGTEVDLEYVIFEGTSDCTVTLQATNLDKQLQSGMQRLDLGIRGFIMTLSVNTGTLYRVSFSGTPVPVDLGSPTPVDRSAVSKGVENVLIRKMFTASDTSFWLRFGKTSVVSGITADHLTGVDSIIVLFYSVGTGEPPRDWEMMFIPMGVQDEYVLYFKAKRSCQAVRIILYDYRGNELQSSRIGLF